MLSWLTAPGKQIPRPTTPKEPPPAFDLTNKSSANSKTVSRTRPRESKLKRGRIQARALARPGAPSFAFRRRVQPIGHHTIRKEDIGDATAITVRPDGRT